MNNPFTDHPKTVSETYWQHMGVALGFGIKMVAGGLACCIHAVFPFAFKCTGSTVCKKLYREIMNRAR